MGDTGMIVSVQFQCGKHSAEWNTELRDPRTGWPMQQLSDRALNDAVFSANELRDLRFINDLREFRTIRAQMIFSHFQNCARQLIDKIEIEEGWDQWMDRLYGKEGLTDGN